VNTLKTIDLMHFGWNVWHHYRGNNQRKDVAKFLKIVFSESFKEMEESTIEKLLSSRKEEGLIKIEDNRFSKENTINIEQKTIYVISMI
jgi:hypothetical protein